MTSSEITAEKEYRITERLGLMCADGEPTPEQRAVATFEADIWERHWRAQHPALTVMDSQAFMDFISLKESL